VRAGRAYRLIVTRPNRAPAWVAGPGRIDHIEIVAVDSGEVVLLWDLPAPQARRLARALREDLSQLEAEEFIAAWRAAQEE
jgi:hypothetical protein